MAQYDVFISYSRKNSDIAHRIEKDLTSKGYSVWIDRDGIFSGDAFKRVLVKAICDSKMLLFLSSQFSNLSEYTAKEASGQYKMGKYYENEGIGNGLNVNKINQASISTAYKWYKLAADQGNKNAIKALDDLKKYQQ